MSDKIPVGSISLIQRNDKFTACEIDFGENVRNKEGAVIVLDMLRQCMNSSAWITSQVMTVPDQEAADAQTEGTGDKTSDPDTSADNPSENKLNA
tara:strand:- start:3 stop:287 length:285 start_codon:yes stop_codon:yes gene_type:complete